MHNLNYTYVAGQASNAALSSSLSNLVDLQGLTASPFWTGFLLRKTSVGREGAEHKSIYLKKCWGAQRSKDFSAHGGELLCPTQ